MPSSGAPPPSGDNAGPRSADPVSGPRPPLLSPRPPAENVAWGAVRDKITALHNFEVLLKSPRVGTKLLAEVLHEFVEGVAVLRGAFANAAESVRGRAVFVARQQLAELAEARLGELERTMERAVASDFDARGRLALEQVVTRVSMDLDAAAELLELSERAEHATATELTFQQLVLVSVSGRARGSDREIQVRVVEPAADERRSLTSLVVDDRFLRTDPHVFKRLVAFSIARVHSSGGGDVSIRATCGEDSARLEIGPTVPDERSLGASALRLVRRIDPTDAIVEAAARSAAIAMTMPTPGTVVLEVPRAPVPA